MQLDCKLILYIKKKIDTNNNSTDFLCFIVRTSIPKELLEIFEFLNNATISYCSAYYSNNFLMFFNGYMHNRLNLYVTEK